MNENEKLQKANNALKAFPGVNASSLEEAFEIAKSYYVRWAGGEYWGEAVRSLAEIEKLLKR